MIYEIKKTRPSELLVNHLSLGGSNGNDKIEVTNKYLMKNGKPWFPVMGEYHFSRADKSEWKTELLKMRAGGISIVSSYVIWIHHEEIEGKPKFTDNCDIREFVKTCYECGLNVFLRVGPWVHGEVKNGGFPDWLINKKDIVLRSNDKKYLEYCKKWYYTLAQQLKGLMFCDGFPLIGIQIENELQRDAEHLETLLSIAKEAGLTAPLYSATAWGIPTDADIPENVFLPVYGAYTERPWAGHINKCEPVKHYFFSDVRNDHTIGADLIPSCKSGYGGIDYKRYPYAACEMGGGIQNTYLRRAVLEKDEIPALTVTKIGCGLCLPGYYVYHGGRNPIGISGTLQESKKTGYPNDLPAVDYSYQGAIGAWGMPNIHYGGIRSASMFLEYFGELLADCDPVFYSDRIKSAYDCDSLRYCSRDNNGKGFIFINNYSRGYSLKNHRSVQFKIGNEIYPEKGIDILDSDYGVLPYNMTFGGVMIKFACVQPLCVNKNCLFLFKPFSGCDSIYIDKDTVTDISGNADIETKNNAFCVSEIKGTLNIRNSRGETVKIAVLSKDEAWNTSIHFGEVFLSKCHLYDCSGVLTAYDTAKENFDVRIFNGKCFEPLNVKAEKRKPMDVEYEEIDVNSFTHKDMEEFELGSDIRKLWKIILPDDRDNLVLQFDITGDIAQLYADGELIADKFLNGMVWEVGPDKKLNCSELLLSVSYLEKGKHYMETDMEYGLEIHEIKALKYITANVDFKTREGDYY